MFICCILLVTVYPTVVCFRIPENHVEIWLVIMILSRKTFHAKQMFVLSSSMKLGPSLTGPMTSVDMCNDVGFQYPWLVC